MRGAGRQGGGCPGPAPEKAAELAGRCGGGQGLLRVPTRGATLTRNAKNSMKEPAGGRDPRAWASGHDSPCGDFAGGQQRPFPAPAHVTSCASGVGALSPPTLRIPQMKRGPPRAPSSWGNGAGLPWDGRRPRVSDEGPRSSLAGVSLTRDWRERLVGRSGVWGTRHIPILTPDNSTLILVTPRTSVSAGVNGEGPEALPGVLGKQSPPSR